MGNRVGTDGAAVVQAFSIVNQTLQVGGDSSLGLNFSFDIPYRIGGACVNYDGSIALDKQVDKNLHRVARYLFISQIVFIFKFQFEEKLVKKFFWEVKWMTSQSKNLTFKMWSRVAPGL